MPQTTYFIAAAEYASFIADAMGASGNDAPPPPQLSFPIDGQTGLDTTVSFTWDQSIDGDGDKVAYRIIVDVEGTGDVSGSLAGVAMCAVPLLLGLLVACPNPPEASGPTRAAPQHVSSGRRFL